MPIVENEDQTEACYVCDWCGEKIEDPEENVVCCSLCNRLICGKCLETYPLRNVDVNPDGVGHKRYRWMCEACERGWKKAHPKQVGLDTFMGA